MSTVWSRIIELLCQLIDLLIDGAFLVLWGLANWLLLKGIHSLHPPTIIVFVLWIAQGIFAVFTLAIIFLHLVHDLKHSPGPSAGFKAIGGKLVDLANHLFALTIFSTLLAGWSGVNSGVHFLLNIFPPEGSGIILFSERIAQFFVSIATLWKIVKPMYKQLRIIYRRLFP